MKKFFLFIAIASLTTFGFSSCRKCETCTATDRTTGAVVNTQEYCGTRSQVSSSTSSYESIWNDTYFSASCK